MSIQARSLRSCCVVTREGLYLPGRLGLLKPDEATFLGWRSFKTSSSVISLGSSTSNFFSMLIPASCSAMVRTARFIRGYSILFLIALFPAVAGQV